MRKRILSQDLCGLQKLRSPGYLPSLINTFYGLATDPTKVVSPKAPFRLCRYPGLFWSLLATYKVTACVSSNILTDINNQTTLLCQTENSLLIITFIFLGILT